MPYKPSVGPNNDLFMQSLKGPGAKVNEIPDWYSEYWDNATDIDPLKMSQAKNQAIIDQYGSLGAWNEQGQPDYQFGAKGPISPYGKNLPNMPNWTPPTPDQLRGLGQASANAGQRPPGAPPAGPPGQFPGMPGQFPGGGQSQQNSPFIGMPPPPQMPVSDQPRAPMPQMLGPPQQLGGPGQPMPITNIQQGPGMNAPTNLASRQVNNPRGALMAAQANALRG